MHTSSLGISYLYIPSKINQVSKISFCSAVMLIMPVTALTILQLSMIFPSNENLKSTHSKKKEQSYNK